jgi:outer membrane protein
MYNKLIRIPIIYIAALTASFSINAQTSSDSLNLKMVINNVIQNNPLLKLSAENINLTALSVEMARSAYLPTIDVNGSYSRMAPIPSFDIPQFGHIQMYPNNSMGLSVDLHQMVYDFGKTGKSITVQGLNKEMSELSTEQLKQNLVLTSAGLFYSLFYLQTAHSIIDEHLNTLKKHLDFVENKQKTGSATQYEILSTQVKVSTTETLLSELETNYNIQLSKLNTLMGQELKDVKMTMDTSTLEAAEFSDTMSSFALSHRDDLLMLEKKKATAEVNLIQAKIQNYPTISLFGSAGYKNGYISDIEKLQANFIVGASLHVPVFQGNRKTIKMNMAGCVINMNKYEMENSTKVAMNEISESYSQLQLSLKKINQSIVQLNQAQQAYDHAEVNYKEGVITNLDLIYASDMLADSKLQLLKNKIDYNFNLLKYKAAMGERIF